jgi:hypothetical protein
MTTVQRALFHNYRVAVNDVTASAATVATNVGGATALLADTFGVTSVQSIAAVGESLAFAYDTAFAASLA